jgi:hypothetical protein
MKDLLALKIPGPEKSSIEIQAPSGIPTGGLYGDGGKIIGFLLSLLLIVAILISFAFIIWGGFNRMTSEGDKAKLESSRKMIIYAIVGLIIVFLSFFLIRLIGAALGVDFLKISL